MNTLEKLRSVLQKRLEDGTPTHITIRVGVVENNIELLMVSCALSPSSRVCYISKSLEQEDKFYSLTEDMDVSSCLAIINLCMEMFPYQTTGALVLPKSLTGMRELFRLANVLTILG